MAENDINQLAPTPQEPRKYNCWVAYPAEGQAQAAKDDDLTVDFVFVHGITGSQTGTWTTKNQKGETVLWPRDLLPASDQIPNSRVIMFGYDADVVNFWAEASQNRLGGHAISLVADLADLRRRTDTMERPIVFVVHSMGGLVVADALHHSKESSDGNLESIYRHTFGIAFLGTPHRGAGLAYWADLGAKFLTPIRRTNKALLKVLKERSETLDRIQTSFHALIRKDQDVSYRDTMRLPFPIKLYCFWEEIPLKGLGKVVEEESARLDGWDGNSIHANHMGMTRFPDSQDPGFRRVIGVLWGWVDDLKKLGASKAVESTATQGPHSSASPPIPDASPQASAPTETGVEGTPKSREQNVPLQSSSQAEVPPTDEAREESSKSKGKDSIKKTKPRKSERSEAPDQAESSPAEQKRTGGSTFNFSRNKGQFAVADTMNFTGAGSMFAAPPRSSGTKGKNRASREDSDDDSEDSD